MSARVTNGKTRARRTARFDAGGVRHALLALLHSVHDVHPKWTLTHCVLAMEAVDAAESGEPHTVISLAKTLDIPYSTASHVIWSLTHESGGPGVLMYQAHPTDRRKKHIVGNPRDKSLSRMTTAVSSMRDYYGDSLSLLKPR